MRIRRPKQPYGSFALFFDNTSSLIGNDRPSLDVNVWVFSDKEASIDFGIRIPRAAQLSTAFFFIPYVLDKSIIDLQETMRDSELTCGIFNTETTMHIDGEKRYFSVSLPSRMSAGAREILYVVPIDGEERSQPLTYFGSGDKNVGTLIVFDIEKMKRDLPEDKGSKLYFRFRIPFTPLTQSLKHTMGFGPDSFSSPLAPHRLPCFVAVNETRQLPHVIGQQLECSRYLFEKRYFVLVTEESWEVESHSDPYRIRQLESGIWGKYWSEANRTTLLGSARRYIVRQYNMGPGKNVTLYFKMSRYKITLWTIVAWIVALGLVDAVGDMISNLFNSIFSLLASMTR